MRLGALALHDLAPPEGLAPHASAPPSVDELRALRDVEVVDLAPLGGVERARVSAPADHLRLPPPPVRATTGHALYASLGAALARFEESRSRPVCAARDAIAAEARMMGLLRGIHGLERDIRNEISRRSRA